MDERAIKAAEDFIDNHSSAIRLWKEDQRRSVAKIMVEFADRHYRAAQTTESTPPTEELKAAANKLIDYCEDHNWGTMPEPCDSINPLLKLLGRGGHSPAPAPQKETK